MDFIGDLNDAAGVDDIIGGVQDAETPEFLAVVVAPQLVVGGAGDDLGAELAQRGVVDDGAQRAGCEDVDGEAENLVDADRDGGEIADRCRG